ncbi:MAG TPA: hypothetical protein VN620_02415 [Candidatus Methylomirabilis sp.]|nr:hypothetical protein [Candidatus Methylomirabilis sp.]
MPCDMIHWSIEDTDRSLWLYTACGLVRIALTELEGWIADPHHRVATSLLDAADGVGLRAVSASKYSPTVARSTDGKLWFVGDFLDFDISPAWYQTNGFRAAGVAAFLLVLWALYRLRFHQADLYPEVGQRLRMLSFHLP